MGGQKFQTSSCRISVYNEQHAYFFFFFLIEGMGEERKLIQEIAMVGKAWFGVTFFADTINHPFRQSETTIERVKLKNQRGE